MIFLGSGDYDVVVHESELSAGCYHYLTKTLLPFVRTKGNPKTAGWD